MTDCPRFNKWIRGCKFEPRYDLGPADLSRFTSIKGYDVEPLLNGLRAKTYRGDVCIYCGKSVANSIPEQGQ
jgi:hypothetical protein